MAKDKKDISLGDILAHIQSLRQEMQQMSSALMKRMEGIEKRMERVEQKVDRMHVTLSGQIDMIDQRLDAIEIENLPKRVAVLEAKMR